MYKVSRRYEFDNGATDWYDGQIHGHRLGISIHWTPNSHRDPFEIQVLTMLLLFGLLLELPNVFSDCPNRILQGLTLYYR